MTDILLGFRGETDKRYRDMGDGTHAEVVALSGTGASIPVTGPLTDTELRATAVPVSGTVTATGPQTDTEARATPQPVSAGSKLGLAANVHAPVAATAAVVTKVAGGVGVVNVLAQVAYSLSIAPAAAVNLMVQDGAAIVFTVDIAAAGPLSGAFQFDPPMKGTTNTAMVITLASGAGTVVGKVSVHSWTE